MATIKEIALLAGVSRGTVDRVLNNRGGVNAETEATIRRIMAEQKFTPNPAGVALAAQKKKYKIGVILFSKMNPFFDAVNQGILDKAHELSLFGCELIVRRVAYDPQAQLSTIRALVKEQIHGLIIAPYNSESIASELNQLSTAGIPVIALNSDVEGAHRLAYVGPDYYNSGKTAAALLKLMTKGPVHLGVLTGDQKILGHAQRFNGFLDSLSEESRFHVVAHEENFDDDQRTYDLVTRMLKKHPEINALYFLTAAVYGGCRALSALRAPKELCVITHDEVPTTVEMMEKGYVTATICQEPLWQGAKALELMFSYLSDGKQLSQEQFLSKLSVQIRETI